MADLADKIDDLICTFDGTLNASLDTLAMYIFGVFVFVLLVLVLSYHVCGKNRKPKSIATDNISTANNIDLKTKDSQKNVTSLGTGNKASQSSPAVRKRLGSKSGKIPNLASNKTRSTFVPPLATGADPEAVKWVNEFSQWLFLDQVVADELINSWIQSLNESMKSSVTEHGVGVELIRMLPETHSPLLNNIFCECAPNDDIKVTCDCEATPAMQLKAFRQRGDKVEVSHYRVNVNKFRSRLNINCITEKLHMNVKFDGWPEIKIMLAQVGSLKNNNLDEQSLQEVIIEIVTTALRSTDIEFNLNGYSGCPRFVRRPVSLSPHLPLHYDSLLTNSNSNLLKGREKLIVKVIKGSGLTPADGVNDAFCVVEVDNPPQTNQTATIRGSESPNWNEQFVFDVNLRTKEIMFEVYNRIQKDSEKNKFIGLAIVSIQELMESVSQRQIISLQSRPYQNDKVSGTLTLEFAFLDASSVYGVNGVQKTEEKVFGVSCPSKGRTVTSKMVYTNPMELDYMPNGVAEKAIRDLESQNRNSNMSPNKSTLIIHSVQKQYQSPNTQQDSAITEKPVVQNNHQAQNEQQTFADATDCQQNGEENGRGRKSRRRDFFGTLRRRLNRSRGRAKSVERNGYDSNVNGDWGSPDSQCNSPPSRATSADRARDHSTHSAHSTGLLAVGPLPREGSTRSSLSEMSGLSGASSRTYLNEASTLVLETMENGVKKHYLVPLSMAQKNKWKKKGTKLHIYNDHTFVAKHLPGGTSCQICNRTLPRRLGKQGYECRDCLMKCHKQCHIRADTPCPSSTIQNIELSGSLKILKLGAGR